MPVLPTNLQQSLVAAGWRCLNNLQPVSGGDIAQAFRFDSGGHTYFLKYIARADLPGTLVVEALGLQALAASKTIAVPQVVSQGASDEYSWLLLPYLEAGPLPDSAAFSFGQALAQLHQHQGPHSGWEEDNLLGRLRQNNTPDSHWPTFWAERRIGKHLEELSQRGWVSRSLLRSLERLQSKLPEFLPPIGRSLLHGDLWSGNYLYHPPEDQCYLIDPAIYYGHSEVDLAMTQLFGGFPTAFYQGYEEIKPFTPGWPQRQAIYQLYYLTAHVLLFGASYLAAVRAKLDFLGMQTTHT